MPKDCNKKVYRFLQWSEEDGCWECDIGCLNDGQGKCATAWDALEDSEFIIDEWLETAKLLGREVNKEIGFMTEHKILGDLDTVLSRRYDKNRYNLSDYQEGAVCLQKEKNGWTVFIGERGNRGEAIKCRTLFMACLRLIRLVTSNDVKIKEMEGEFLKLLERDKLCPRIFSDDDIQKYIDKVYEEMARRNIREDNIPKVIAKTGFLDAIKRYPEEQFHESIESAVDEILVIASQHGLD